MNGYSLDLMLRYSIERKTKISQYIENSIALGIVYNESLQLIFTNIVSSYYGQKQVIGNFK